MITYNFYDCARSSYYIESNPRHCVTVIFDPQLYVLLKMFKWNSRPVVAQQHEV